MFNVATKFDNVLECSVSAPNHSFAYRQFLSSFNNEQQSICDPVQFLVIQFSNSRLK